MLNAIREKTKGWIAFILLGSITVPFALWGISSYFSNDSSANVAKVDGIAISIAAYRDALQQQQAQYEQMLGSRADPSLFSSPAFKQMALQTLINRTLLIHDAERSGFRVPSIQLAAIIRHMIQFRKNGHFNAALYRSTLQAAGYGVGQFESMMRVNVLLSQVQDGIVQSAFLTRADLNGVLDLLAEQRKITYAVLDPKRFPVTVSASAIAAYYQQHVADFTKPEQVRIDYVHLSPRSVAATMEVSEADLRRLYNRHRDQFRIPSERRASNILIALPANATAVQQVQALTKIESIQAKLKAGARFSNMARRYSQDAGSAAAGGNLGYVRRGTLPQAIDKMLFSLKLGQVGGPVRTRYGYHLVKLTGIRHGTVKSFGQARDDLEHLARERAASNKISDFADRLRRLVYEHPKSLEPAASALHLQIKESPWLSSRGVGGTDLTNTSAVLKAAFSPQVLNAGDNSSVIRIARHSYVALRVAEHRPAIVMPLAQVRPKIVAQLQAELESAAAKQQADMLLAKLRTGAPAPKISGVEWQTPEPFAREGNLKLDPRLVAAVFAAPGPKPGSSVDGEARLASGAYAVFVLTQVIPGKPSDVGVAARNETRNLIQEYGGAEYFRDYLDGLRKRAKIKIYSNNL